MEIRARAIQLRKMSLLTLLHAPSLPMLQPLSAATWPRGERSRQNGWLVCSDLDNNRGMGSGFCLSETNRASGYKENPTQREATYDRAFYDRDSNHIDRKRSAAAEKAGPQAQDCTARAPCVGHGSLNLALWVHPDAKGI